MSNGKKSRWVAFMIGAAIGVTAMGFGTIVVTVSKLAVG